jgi:hypothetical protein
MAQTAGRIIFRKNTVSKIEAQLNSVESKQMAHFRAANDTYSAAACRRVVFVSVWVVGVERTPSAASETEEAAGESESRPRSYTADEFLTGAGSKHAQIMRSAAIELLDSRESV